MSQCNLDRGGKVDIGTDTNGPYIFACTGSVTAILPACKVELVKNPSSQVESRPGTDFNSIVSQCTKDSSKSGACNSLLVPQPLAKACASINLVLSLICFSILSPPACVNNLKLSSVAHNRASNDLTAFRRSVTSSTSRLVIFSKF